MATVPRATLALAKRSSPATPLAVAGIAAGVLSTALVLPIGFAFAVAALSIIGVLGLRSSIAPLREALAEYALERARYGRRDARERALSAASYQRDTLHELTRLVDDIERADPDLAARLELEPLLDRFVELANGHERAMRAVGMASRVQLERICESLHDDAAADPRRAALADLRLRCQRECEARAEHFADELALVADLIHLAAQRTACPEAIDDDGELPQRLAELA